MWNETTQRELLGLLRDMIRIDTTNPPGREAAMAAYLGELMDREGIPWHTREKAPGRTNFVARLPGGEAEKKPPLLFISHVDVVPAGPGWTKPAFEALIEDGILYGRGAIDTKHLTAMEVLAMALLKREGRPLNRDVVLLATADEEQGSGFGMDFLTREFPEDVPRGYVFNEGGGFVMELPGKKLRTFCCGEKGNCAVDVKIPRLPGREKLALAARVVGRLAAYESPQVEDEVTRGFAAAAGEPPYADPTLQNLWDYSTHHNMTIQKLDISGEDGEETIHTVMKFLPGMDRGEIEALYASLLRGLPVTWEVVSCMEGYRCDMDNEFVRILSEKSREHDPGSELLPMYALGNTDGRFLRHNVFGYSPLLADTPFKKVLSMVHQDDESITLPSLYYGGRVIYETARQLCLG